MNDAIHTRKPKHHDRIVLSDAYDVEFWVCELGCTEDELRAAVNEHGDEVAKIRRVLKKQPDATKMEWD
jgi:hypothetical protein